MLLFFFHVLWFYSLYLFVPFSFISFPHFLCLALVPACLTFSAFSLLLIIKANVGTLPINRVLQHGVCVCWVGGEAGFQHKTQRVLRDEEKEGGKFSLKSCDSPVSP